MCLRKRTLRSMRTGVVVFLAAALPILTAAGSGASADTFRPAEIAARTAPAVVQVTGHMRRGDPAAYAEASGFFVENDGLLISIASVFTDPATRRQCEAFTVRLADGRQLPAEMVSVDAILNLMVLRVGSPGPYPAVDPDSTAAALPGKPVLAVAGRGATGGASYTVGQVQAPSKKSIYGAGLRDMFIHFRPQAPAQAFGGPLLSEDGQVLGINTPDVHGPDADSADVGETHTLPMLIVRGFIRMSKAYPTSRENWLGIAFRPLTSEEKSAVLEDMGRDAGLLVDYVWAEGPAAGLDIQVGDILFGVDGEVIPSLHHLSKVLWRRQPGSRLDLALLREGNVNLRTVALEKRPAWAGHVAPAVRAQTVGGSPPAAPERH